MNAQLKPFPDIDAKQHAFHARLTLFNARRFKPALPGPDWAAALTRDLSPLKDEGDFLERERASIQPLMADVPHQADAFMVWFEALREHGPVSPIRCLRGWRNSPIGIRCAGFSDRKWPAKRASTISSR